LTSCHSPGSPGPDFDFLCRQPIQFRFEEYVTFSPWLPLPVETQDGFDGHVVRNLAASEDESTVGVHLASAHTRLSYFFPLLFGKIIQFSDGNNTAKTYHYEPVRLSSASETGRNLRHALDVVITGEVCAPFCLDGASDAHACHRHPVDLKRPGARIALSDGFDYQMV